MALKKINENPTLGDSILLEIETPDASGCFLADPYRVDNLKIFYVERSFAGGTDKEYADKIYDDEKLRLAVEAETLACNEPTDEHIATAKLLRAEAENGSHSVNFYYNSVTPVKIIGNSETPAWMSTDTSEALIEKVETDSDGNSQFGKFTFTWEPIGFNEGDYFLCWTWTPLQAGSSLTANLKFKIDSTGQLGVVTPSHFTVENKYETLLDLYLPEMFKTTVGDNDKTPVVLDNFNKATAKLFTFLENLANQTVDLLDANATRESCLPLLANMFDVKLRTNDPVLWRRQIKNAVPYFKQKGTLQGLTNALAQIGVKLNKFTKLWQIVSSYTWQESFVYEDSPEFLLEKHAWGLDEDNFELYYRAVDTDVYQELSSDYIAFSQQGTKSYLTWVGESLSTNPIALSEGDIVRVVYKYAGVPNNTEQTLENYIRSLPLADQRDELDQIYPKKNWNVRLIEEDDVLFSLIIKNKHPFYDPVVFGKVRTEFAYSENAYNMDEYNGSIRDSIQPCDIDRDFIDSCNYCQSSKFNVDVEIENLSNDKILESQAVIKEFVPFHAVLQTLNFVGGIYTYVSPPVEDVQTLVLYKENDLIISGGSQQIFNRAMKNGLTINRVARDQLASSTVVVNNQSGTASNTDIVLFCPHVNFSTLGLATNGESILEVLAPSASAGSYTLSAPDNNRVVVTGVSEPIDTAEFTFRINNLQINGSYTCNVYEDNIFQLFDEDLNFSALGVSSTFDVQQGLSGGAWKVLISDYSATPYTISNVLPSGALLLADPDKTLPLSNVSVVEFSLLNATDNVIETSSGNLDFTKRSRVETLSSAVTNIKNLVKIGNYCVIGGGQYKVLGYPDDTNDQFYIERYNEGDLAGQDLIIYQRCVDNQIGYFGYQGMKLVTTDNYESDLEISNGSNPPDENDVLQNSRFIENFIVLLESEYYFITAIDGTTITLSGPPVYYKKTGTGVSFSIYRYEKQPVTIDEQDFSFIDRRGKEIVNLIETSSTTDLQTTVSLMNAGSPSHQVLAQSEAIQFNIEWRD